MYVELTHAILTIRCNKYIRILQKAGDGRDEEIKSVFDREPSRADFLWSFVARHPGVFIKAGGSTEGFGWTEAMWIEHLEMAFLQFETDMSPSEDDDEKESEDGDLEDEESDIGESEEEQDGEEAMGA